MALFDFLKKKDKGPQKEETQAQAVQEPEVKAEQKPKTLPRVSAVPPEKGEQTYDVYIKHIGDTYVMRKQLNLSEDELQEMTITDCAEAWRLYNWYNREMRPGITEEELKEADQRIAKLVLALSDKVLSVDKIYCLYSRFTGLPYLVSNTYRQPEGGFYCTAPLIRIFTDQSLEVAKTFPETLFELRVIESGEDKKGIKRFLETCAFVYGAEGVAIVSEETFIPLKRLVSEPDFSHLPEVQRPITNPDVLRWISLMAQLDIGESEDAKQIYGIYSSLLDQSLPSAKFLVPAIIERKNSGESSEGNFSAGDTLRFVIIEGKEGREAIQMFTDWHTFRACHPEGFDGIIMGIDEMIGEFDIAINPNRDFPRSGCYIDQVSFEKAKNSLVDDN